MFTASLVTARVSGRSEQSRNETLDLEMTLRREAPQYPSREPCPSAHDDFGAKVRNK
jgi:hypothetical protein